MAIVLPYRGFDIHVDDLERPYFEAAAQGRLIVQACEECSIVRYPPALRCLSCGSAKATWRDTNGNGRVSACLIVEHGVRDTFPAPYAIGLVQLDDLAAQSQPEYTVRILSTILRADESGSVTDPMPDGTPVQACFRPIADGFSLPMFRIADG